MWCMLSHNTSRSVFTKYSNQLGASCGLSSLSSNYDLCSTLAIAVPVHITKYSVIYQPEYSVITARAVKRPDCTMTIGGSNTLKPRQNGHYFADDIFLNENAWISIEISLTGFYTKGRPLVKSNLIRTSDKLSWQPVCPVLNINIQGNFCISQGNGSSDNLLENLV